MTTLTIEYDEKSWAPDIAGRLVDDAGEVLYQHVSSHKGWLERDLTSNFGRDTELSERFPDGFTLAWKDIHADA